MRKLLRMANVFISDVSFGIAIGVVIFGSVYYVDINSGLFRLILANPDKFRVIPDSLKHFGIIQICSIRLDPGNSG